MSLDWISTGFVSYKEYEKSRFAAGDLTAKSWPDHSHQHYGEDSLEAACTNNKVKGTILISHWGCVPPKLSVIQAPVRLLCPDRVVEDFFIHTG